MAINTQQEIKNFPVVGARIDPDKARKLEDYCYEQRIKKSDFLKPLIERAIDQLIEKGVVVDG